MPRPLFVNTSPKWRVLASGLAFPEGPAFAPDGTLWWVELEGGCLGRIEGGRVERVSTGGSPNGLAFDRQGRAVFCDSGMNAVRRYDPVRCRHDILAEGLFGPNDLCFDSRGVLLFTCPGDSRHEPAGYVAALHPCGRVARIAQGMFFPNGLALGPDQETLIVAETYRQRLWKGRWDGESWREAEPWMHVGGPVGPDGMVFGPGGRLYVAIYGQKLIAVVAPDGRLEATIETPGMNPTNAAIDPRGELGLVVTEAERGEILSRPIGGAAEEIPGR